MLELLITGNIEGVDLPRRVFLALPMQDPEPALFPEVHIAAKGVRRHVPAWASGGICAFLGNVFLEFRDDVCEVDAVRLGEPASPLKRHVS